MCMTVAAFDALVVGEELRWRPRIVRGGIRACGCDAPRDGNEITARNAGNNRTPGIDEAIIGIGDVIINTPRVGRSIGLEPMTAQGAEEII